MQEPLSTIDIEITGYLDGELEPAARQALEERFAAEPALRARRDRLAAGRPDVRAFDRLLDEAPEARLAAILAGASAVPPASPRTGRHLGIAAAIMLVVGGIAGFAVARFALPPAVEVVQAPRENWREAVADYMDLYTDETLSIIADDPAQRDAELAAANRKLSLALTPENVALPGMALKRTELLDFRGMPLAQIAYLSPSDGPVAFCIIANGKPDIPLTLEKQGDWNVGFWNAGGVGYMVIGRVAPDALETLAKGLESRV
ncbi:MAG: hypothetical protein KDJ88_04280 [Bauldia sp.]|nr:hypothetical protein [Bauldia sp.]